MRRKRTSRQRTSSVALWAWFLSCTGYRLMTRPHGLTVPPRLGPQSWCHSSPLAPGYWPTGFARCSRFLWRIVRLSMVSR